MTLVLLSGGFQLAVGSEWISIFSTQFDGYVAALWIMDTDGKHLRRVSDPRLTASVPDVSPDGKQVIFNDKQNSAGLSNIFKMNLDGTGAAWLQPRSKYLKRLCSKCCGQREAANTQRAETYLDRIKLTQGRKRPAMAGEPGS